VHLIASAIFYYDHLITLGNEINYLWRRPKGASAYWFFFNRYLAFFGNLIVTYLGCESYNTFRQLLLIVSQVLVCILLTLRIHALYGRLYRILGFMGGSAAVLIVISCWSIFGQKSVASASGQAAGCHIAQSKETAVHQATAWEALFVYDSMIFGFTIFKTWQTRREHIITGIRIPLISLILRDGINVLTIFHSVMALANLANILTFYPFLRGGLSTFASSISVMMMSRLMLNLHESASIGIFSTQLSTGLEYAGTPEYNTTEDIELDTLWNDSVDQQSSFPPNISRIDHPSILITSTNVT
ncbi:hypothetical protein BDQ12DRAFT_771575, partial [Crucibulum laeve]